MMSAHRTKISMNADMKIILSNVSSHSSWYVGARWRIFIRRIVKEKLRLDTCFDKRQTLRRNVSKIASGQLLHMFVRIQTGLIMEASKCASTLTTTTLANMCTQTRTRTHPLRKSMIKQQRAYPARQT